MQMQVEEALIIAKSGDLTSLKRLNLKSEGVERFVDGRGATLAHYAARGGHVGTLEYLTEQGVDGSLRSRVGATPAHDAAATGNADALVWVLKNTECSVEDRDDGGCTVSHLCALYGHMRALKWLVTEGGASTVTKTKAGALPLHFAATNGDLDIVKFLVEQKPGTVNAQLDSGATSAYLASQEGHLEVLEYLVEEGGVSTKILAHDGMSCLHAAAQMGHIQCVQWLVQSQRLDINARDFDGATPLHFACGQGHLDVVEWLLGSGAKVTKDNLGGTPLHAAAEHGQLQVVRVLLQHGLDSSVQDNDGLTAAQLAELCWQAECAAAIKRRATQILALNEASSGRDSPVYNSPIYDEVGPRFNNLRDSFRTSRVSDYIGGQGRAMRPNSFMVPPPPSMPPPPLPGEGSIQEESPSLVSTASQTSLDYENVIPGLGVGASLAAPPPPPPPPLPPQAPIPAPPPPPLPAIPASSDTLNSRKSNGASSNYGSRSSTLTKDKNFGSNQNIDLIAELKAANGMMSLKKTKTKPLAGSRVIYSTPVKTPEGTKEPPATTRNVTNNKHSSKNKPELTGEYDPKNFLDQVPEKDTTGRDIPPWKKLIVARQLAEKALQDDTERKKVEAEEAKWRDMPPWKRALLEKKAGESSVTSESSGSNSSKETKTSQQDAKALSSRSQPEEKKDLLTVPNPVKNGHLVLDEDGLPLPPWKQEVHPGKTPITV